MKAKLVLLGRRNHQDRVERLLSTGAEVLFANADVTDVAEMRQALDRAYRRFGAIHGVVHAAGVAGDGLIQLKTTEAAANVLAPKVTGTLVLADLLKDTPLDFFVLFSSIRSLQGGVGHSDYCAANAFLDAFARHKGAPVQSINWGAWSEVGMSADYVREHNLNADELLDTGMSSAEGVEAFARALETNLAQIIVAPQDLETLLTESTQATAPKTATRAVHQRPRLKDAFVAPQTETEQLIAGFWRELLGVEKIGIHDNFFELGGDSILSLRITARANEAGLSFRPNDIFKHQTIAELATIAGTSVVVQAEQGTPTGEVPLTPIQKWFFEQRFTDQHHWNQAVLLELPNGGEPALIEQVMNQLVAHHDTLRLRFHDRVQHYIPLEEPLPIAWIDLTGLSDAERLNTIESESTKAQSTLNLSEGPLLRAVAFGVEKGRVNRLLIVIHHLLIDVVSWRILLEDFVTAYDQLSRGHTVSLPAKTTSYQLWSKRLTDLAQSEAVKADVPYWQEQSRKAASRLPVDFVDGRNTVASAQTVFVSLNIEETTALLHEVPSVYQTQITDALLTALVRAVKKSTGGRAMLVELESHGRESNDLDLSRTVGWFTSAFPVLLELDTNDLAETMKSVKEQLRRIPRNGLSYGLLRYLSDTDIHTDQSPEIGFLYLGQLDQELSSAAPIKLAQEPHGPSQSPRQERSHLLDFESRVAGGELQVSLTYSQNLHRPETVERLAQAFIEELRALIAHCQSAQAMSYTPSDFPEAELNQQELDELITSLTLS